ncbi:hypothetical protein C0991_001416 [Blastosporella zonata]|nr:hypothetical protein C0991_001416 [Blastosporella zonata]
MKLLASVITVSAFAAVAIAQGITIGNPPSGASVKQGKKITVKILRPDHIEFSTEVGIVLGLATCQSGTCPGDSEIGTILHNGKFDPEFHGPGQQFQNFTVKIPADFPLGEAQLSATRFFLIGAGPSPTIGSAVETLNVIHA